MKLLLSAAVFVSLSFFLSCKKIADFEAPCKIMMLTEKYQHQPIYPIEYDTLRIYYNSKGNPVRLDYTSNETGKPDYFFTYDNKDRLIELVSKYGSFIEFTHKYYYNNNQFIEYDTTFYADQSIRVSYVIHKYTYDDKGRIIRIDDKTNFGAEFSHKYGYNTTGNRILQQGYPVDGSTYDNKINLLRTNLIFCFLNRDYSVNNLRAATSYNTKDLPLAFPFYPTTDPNVLPRIHFLNMMVHEVTYSCEH